MKKIILALLVSMISLSSFAVEISCNGTEPFWNASVKKGIITYLSPELEKTVSLKVTSTQQAAGFTENNSMVIKTKYTTLSLISGECSDGMSDETYSHHALYDYNGVLLGGCCNVM